jgi:hypothetical protein
MNRAYNRISTRLQDAVSTNSSLVSLLLGIFNIIILVLSFILLVGGIFFIQFGTGNEESERDWYMVNLPIICFGSLGIALSLYGLILCCFGRSNRLLLSIYVVVCILIFLSHLSAFIYFLSDWESFEEDHRRSLQSTITRINSGIDVVQECEFNMKKISSLLYCCGFNGTADFTNTKPMRCCAQGLDISGKIEVPGCWYLSLKRLRKFCIMFFLVPSCVSLAVELFVFVSLSLLIRRMQMVEKNNGTAIYRREVVVSNE